MDKNKQIRPLWGHYLQNTDGLIWVVDSNDRERLFAPSPEENSSYQNYGYSYKDEFMWVLGNEVIEKTPIQTFFHLNFTFLTRIM